MIFRYSVGTGLSGALRYIQGPGRDENGIAKTAERAQFLGQNGIGFDLTDKRRAEIARRMMEYNSCQQMQASHSKDCIKDCLHISLSWAPGQKPDQAEKLEACQTFLKALGMDNAMAQFWSHNDRSYDHVHIVASMINPETGLTYDDYQRLYKGLHCAIEWERVKQQITKERQWCHDLANATRDRIDHDELMQLLFKGEATVKRSKLDLALAFGGHLGKHLEAQREEFVRLNELIGLKKYKNGRTFAYTQKDIFLEEERVLSNARHLKEMDGFGVSDEIIEKHAKGLTLSKQQLDGLRHLTRSDGFAILKGQAGSGKSHVANAVRKAYQDAGYRVKGLAFTNKVAQDLQKQGFDSSTIASELGRLRGKTPHWNDKTVILIDEAAQLDTPKHLREVFYQAQKHKAKVLMVGDNEQLGSIDRGGLFTMLEKRFGSAKLNEIMRTPHKDQKQAFNHMHDRKWDKAIDLFKKSNSVRWNDNKMASKQALVDEYTRDFLENPDAERQIVAMANDDVNELNRFVRELRQQHGFLGKDTMIDTAQGPLGFAKGDRIALAGSSANREEKKKGLINGAFGTISDIKTRPDGKHEITMKADRGKNQQPRSFKFTAGLDTANGDISISHGYASTVYKSQGATLDKTYVIHDTRSTRPTNYVSMSRHRDRVSLFVSREDTPGYDALAEQMGQGERKTSAHDYLVEDKDRIKLQDHRKDRDSKRDDIGYRQIIKSMLTKEPEQDQGMGYKLGLKQELKKSFKRSLGL